MNLPSPQIAHTYLGSAYCTYHYGEKNYEEYRPLGSEKRYGSPCDKQLMLRFQFTLQGNKQECHTGSIRVLRDIDTQVWHLKSLLVQHFAFKFHMLAPQRCLLEFNSARRSTYIL